MNTGDACRYGVALCIILGAIPMHAITAPAPATPTRVTVQLINRDTMPAVVDITTGSARTQKTLNRSGGSMEMELPADAQVAIHGHGIGSYYAFANDLASCTIIASDIHPTLQRPMRQLSVTRCQE